MSEVFGFLFLLGLFGLDALFVESEELVDRQLVFVFLKPFLDICLPGLQFLVVSSLQVLLIGRASLGFGESVPQLVALETGVGESWKLEGLFEGFAFVIDLLGFTCQFLIALQCSGSF